MNFIRNLLSTRSLSSDFGDTTIDGSNGKNGSLNRKTVSFEDNVKCMSYDEGADMEEEIVQIRFAGSKKPKSLTVTEEFKPSGPQRPGMRKTKSIFTPPTTPAKDRPIMARRAVSVHGERLFNEAAEKKIAHSKFVIPEFKQKDGTDLATSPKDVASITDSQSLETITEESEKGKGTTPVPSTPVDKRQSPVPKLIIQDIPSFKHKIQEKRPSLDSAKEEDLQRGDEDMFKGI